MLIAQNLGRDQAQDDKGDGVGDGNSADDQRHKYGDGDQRDGGLYRFEFNLKVHRSE